MQIGPLASRTSNPGAGAPKQNESALFQVRCSQEGCLDDSLHDLHSTSKAIKKTVEDDDLFWTVLETLE